MRLKMCITTPQVFHVKNQLTGFRYKNKFEFIARTIRALWQFGPSPKAYHIGTNARLCLRADESGSMCRNGLLSKLYYHKQCDQMAILFLIFGHFEQKFVHKYKIFAKVGSQFCQILSNYSRNGMAKNVWKYCLSGEILPNPVTLFIKHF